MLQSNVTYSVLFHLFSQNIATMFLHHSEIYQLESESKQ